MPGIVTAQPLLRPDSGARVRVSVARNAPAAGVQRITGTLTGFRGDTLHLQRDQAGLPQAIPISTVVGLDASRGRHARAGRGALIGLAAGAASGAAFGAVICALDTNHCHTNDTFLAIDPAGVIVGLGFVGAVAGTGIGALVGSFLQTDRWRPVPLGAMRTSIAPIPGGVRFGVSLPLPATGR